MRVTRWDLKNCQPKKEDRARAQKILTILAKAYPDARVMLHYTNPLELLIATILAAQCTDERVNQVTKVLFKRYRSAKAYAEADPKELEAIIHPTGFFRAKARSIIGCCKKLVEEFGGNVPGTLEELTRLPGVGRKTANIILGNAFGKQAIAVDTHVKRVSNRLGLASSDDPDKIEEQLAQVIPKTKWTLSTHLLVFHGRKVCQARNPLCPQCPVEKLCPWPGKRA